MRYIYQSKDTNLEFEDAVKILRQKLKNKIIVGTINNADPNCIISEYNDLKKMGVSTQKFDIDRNEYIKYIVTAKYKERYSEYYKSNFYEKTLEHFLCYNFTDIKKGDNFIDIASEHSPVADIFQRLTDCNAYSQDIMYKPGIHDNKIGSDASDIPVSDNFFNAAVATCSIEHFENDSDIKFMKEMGRILVKGGKIVIVPLYLYPKESCQTDPVYSYKDVKFDKGHDIYCAENWGNRHSRHYSPISLYERLIKPNKNINFKIYLIDNPQDIDRSIYCRFILIGTKI